ncbi:O-antigen ligase family protein [Microbacterium sp.]|uniref:O-antigen ligase family protein n=1 Tax=Microbacterium sp. TaxID=51671 RepID=UPI003A841508
MTAHTSHPVSAPPTAPVRETTGHILLRGWCIFLLATAVAGTGWLMAFGATVTGIVCAVTAVVSIALWLVLRPGVHGPRLPWFGVLYVLWAVASLMWSAWPAATTVTLFLLLVTTGQGVFVATMLTWRELVRSIASALKWVLSLSILFELWVSCIWGGPILPGFVRPTGPVDDPIVLWSRDNLFDGGRLQGIFGNANALAYVALLAVIVFALRYASAAPRRTLLIGWMALAAFLFVRAASATATVAAALAVLVLAAALSMRRARRPADRTRNYVIFAIVGAAALTAMWTLRGTVLAVLGRSADLTGREAIWAAVGDRIAQRPVLGWGYSTPWVPDEAGFDGWIVDHGVTVMQAHNMWIDVLFQLGIIGVVLAGLAYLAFVWRSWFFAVDRPRWDLVADRPYSPITLLPTLVGAILIVQGMAESTPLLGWGWMFLVMLAFKIKQAPLLGRGPSEQRLVGEQGERLIDS